ncbi:MAG: hypothetical protein ACI9KE_006470 [Polyangiales bacterium]|jgi:uncharacterized protein (DUF2384 family)
MLHSLESTKELTPERRSVLTKAVLRAAEKLTLSNTQLAGVLGVSPSTVSRMREAPLNKPKSTELGLLFVRVYRSLIGVVDSDQAAAQWMTSHNHHLGGEPAELIQSVTGLFRTLEYLDAMRAKV